MPEPQIQQDNSPARAASLPQEAGEPRFLISDLLSYLETYLAPEHVRAVYDAYLFSADAHLNQKRLSGEPYIYHPIPSPGCWRPCGWITSA